MPFETTKFMTVFEVIASRSGGNGMTNKATTIIFTS
jgi:hypothetical protein